MNIFELILTYSSIINTASFVFYIYGWYTLSPNIKYFFEDVFAISLKAQYYILGAWLVIGCFMSIWLIYVMTRIMYFGTDPNYKLTKKLNELGEMYNDVNGTGTYDIRTQGSEIFIPEWENKMGLAFSSPPYYNLEDYKHGEQSIKNYETYENWLNSYWDSTVKNIKKYLCDDGIMLLNIKNFNKFNLLDDMKEICERNGLIFQESIELKNNNRTILAKHGKSNSEEILVFSKNEINTQSESLINF